MTLSSRLEAAVKRAREAKTAECLALRDFNSALTLPLASHDFVHMSKESAKHEDAMSEIERIAAELNTIEAQQAEIERLRARVKRLRATLSNLIDSADAVSWDANRSIPGLEEARAALAGETEDG